MNYESAGLRVQSSKLKGKSWIKLLVVLLFLVTLHFALSTLNLRAYALTMSNGTYIIQMGDLNMGAGKPTGSGYQLGFTLGQTAPGLYSGANYKVRAGFQYISSIIKFRFSISTTAINFGTLSPTSPVSRTNTLTLSNGSANGYSVTAYENHQLLQPGSGQLIPDTTCDNGACTQTTSGPWTGSETSLTYGFGYRCDNVTGTDCATGFSDSTYYKQFSDNSNSETAQAVMTGTNVGRNKAVQITYRVNVSGSQPPGLYTNVITYVATPTF